jgi:hypothetical protein
MSVAPGQVDRHHGDQPASPLFGNPMNRADLCPKEIPVSRPDLRMREFEFGFDRLQPHGEDLLRHEIEQADDRRETVYAATAIRTACRHRSPGFPLLHRRKHCLALRPARIPPG